MIITACFPAHAASGALKSPWEIGPVIQNIEAKTKSCPPPPALASSLTTESYYKDAAHSVIDRARKRAYQQATRPLYSAVRQLEKMADRYRATGDPALAACAANWLQSFAGSNLLLGHVSGNQSAYVQGWMLGAVAVSWLKIRSAENLAPESEVIVPSWLAKVADSNIGYYADRNDKKDGRNNHRYWAGFAVMAAGIAADRRDLFDWGLESFRIGTRQVTADGFLPLEADRRSRALHYHLFAAAPLVMTAELAAANDLDLYREEDAALPRLIAKAVSGIRNPLDFAAKAGAEQEEVKPDPGDIVWAIPFERRFPNAELRAMLAAQKSRSILYIGGLPPGVSR